MSLALRVSACCMALAITSATAAAQTVAPPPTLAQREMVVSIHHDASDAGVEVLKACGYTVRRINEADKKDPGVWGDCEMIYLDPNTRMLLGEHDQRHNFGQAAGY